MGDTAFPGPARQCRADDHQLLPRSGQTLLPIDLGSDSIYFDPPPLPFGGSGLASTPRDYDKFLADAGRARRIWGAAGDERGGGALGTSDLLPDTLLPEDSYKTGPWGFGAGGRVGRGS